MNLAEWLQGDHEPSQRLKAVESLCRAVIQRSGGATLSLDPARIQVGVNGECRPEEGKGVPPGRYRPPEIPDGRPPTPQSQVYTVGVLCFEILAGRPFEPRGGPLLRDVRPDLPRDLSDAVQACLETDAEWRPKDLSYVLGLVEGMGSPGAAAARPAGRGGRAASVSPPPSRPSRRAAPAPRPWPLLIFALVALAASVASAVVRLKQPIDPPSLPPGASAAPLPSPPGGAAASEGASPASLPATSRVGATPAPNAGRAASASAATPSAGGAVSSSIPARPLRPSSPGTTVTAPPRAGSAAAAAAPSPATTTAGAAPLPTLASPAATPAAAPVRTEPVGPAAVTSVAPPLLRRGATVLVDVHGVGLRSEHQVRIGRGREAARGIQVMRQRYVGPALLQVLLRVDPSASPGAHVLYLVDGAGNATNTRPLEVSK